MIIKAERVNTASGKVVGSLGLFVVNNREEANEQLLQLAQSETGALATATKTAVHPYGFRGNEHWRLAPAEAAN